MSWTILLLVQFALLALGLGLSVYLFGTVKLEVRRMQKLQAARQGALEASFQELSLKTEELDRQIGEWRAARQARGSYSAIDLTRRMQVLRMYRRGEAPATISAAIGIPAAEVELLLKVQRIIMGEN